MEIFKYKYHKTIFGHQVYLGLDESCYQFEVIEDIVTKAAILELFCQHEEADTRIIWHVKHVIDIGLIMGHRCSGNTIVSYR